jgi:hypothetical protein
MIAASRNMLPDIDMRYRKFSLYQSKAPQCRGREHEGLRGPAWELERRCDRQSRHTAPLCILDNRSFLFVSAQAELPNPANQDGIVFHLVDHLAWPITLIFLVIMVAYNKTLARLFGLSPKIIRKIKAGGVEIELNAEEIDALRSHFLPHRSKN